MRFVDLPPIFLCYIRSMIIAPHCISSLHFTMVHCNCVYVISAGRFCCSKGASRNDIYRTFPFSVHICCRMTDLNVMCNVLCPLLFQFGPDSFHW